MLAHLASPVRHPSVAFVQSTDKNLLVPVGGAIVAGPDAALLRRVAQTYPGRASNGPVLYVFMTLLSLGSSGYERLLRDRKVGSPCVRVLAAVRPCSRWDASRQAEFTYLRDRLGELATKHGLRVLTTPHNDISLGTKETGTWI